jgi:hypothetical protein
VEWLGAFLGGLEWGQVPLAGLVGLVIVLILTGKLRWHTDMEWWRDAYQKSDEVNRALVKQNGQLLDAAKTTTQVVKSLRKEES